MPPKVAAERERLPELQHAAQGYEAQLPQPLAEVSESSSAEHIGSVALPGLDTEKFAAVAQHGGSMQKALEMLKADPSRPLPGCLQRLGFTSLHEVVKRVEGTDDPTTRAPTIRELREAKRQQATHAEKPKPATANRTEAKSEDRHTRHENFLPSQEQPISAQPLGREYGNVQTARAAMGNRQYHIQRERLPNINTAVNAIRPANPPHLYVQQPEQGQRAAEVIASDKTDTPRVHQGIQKFAGATVSAAAESVAVVLRATAHEKTEDVLHDPEPGLSAAQRDASLSEIDTDSSNSKDLEPATGSWEGALAKEPREVYMDFTGALQAFAELPALPPTAEAEDSLPVDGSAADATAQETEPVPNIAAMVAERLTELDDSGKELVSQVVVGIVSTIHEIRILESQDTDPLKRAAAEAELEELCIELIKAIDIDYDLTSVRQFMYAITRADFEPPQSDTTVVHDVDLDNEGTREAKLHFPQFAADGVDVHARLQQLLGVFVLFCMHHTYSTA